MCNEYIFRMHFLQKCQPKQKYGMRLSHTFVASLQTQQTNVKCKKQHSDSVPMERDIVAIQIWVFASLDGGSVARLGQ